MDQFDRWQVVPRQAQVFTFNSLLLISAVFVVVSQVGCLGVTKVTKGSANLMHDLQGRQLPSILWLYSGKMRKKNKKTFHIISILSCYGKCYVLISNSKKDSKV